MQPIRKGITTSNLYSRCEHAIFKSFYCVVETNELIPWRIEKSLTSYFDSGTVLGLTPGRLYEVTIWVTSGDVRSNPTKIPEYRTR